MKGPLKPTLITIVIIAAMAFALAKLSKRGGIDAEGGELTLYCAAGIRYAVESIVDDYLKEYKIQVITDYGGSGELLSRIGVARRGDLYIAADEDHIDLARERGLVRESIPIAFQRPALAVKKGNPKGIKGIDDLLRDDVKVSIANDTASVGKKTIALLTKLGKWKKVAAVIQTTGSMKPTVNDVANDVKMRGIADVGIVWDSTVAQYPDDLEKVDIPGSEDFVEQVTIGVLEFSENPTRALQFARYLTARDRGLKRFREKGWPTVQDGDLWEEKPDIIYYCGGTNRGAVEETIAEFEAREGVQLSTTYMGCGALVANIKGGLLPDVYQTCDSSFISPVQEFFGDVVDISSTKIVILIANNKADEIKSVNDLTKPGLKIGMTNPDISAMGFMTRKLLKALDLWDEIVAQDNIAVQVPQGDMLVPQLTEGHLDAALMFESNSRIAVQAGKAKVVAIDHPLALSTQTYSVGKNSKHKYLMGRFLDALGSAKSEKRYEEAGFTYLANKGGSR